ncbi:MFS transporter [Corynebacterium sp. ES2794-CONJ1]|nr:MULTISPECIES: MFS transporter [unclassified Corynebacterium]MCS4489853.1 MFS transporter [Corynebacterium sp. ES2775-CONJ]MCS4491783.1 MFS transporter [Corynebacterium sp. ES2715-CONJ3]MCS4531888.1 MFS transporter [Corynebacterium sp. ES2730-CONJ]MCU9519288.1 MFS transporter [Corynebacterium sp. ES2794-CONJ1]
MAEEPTTKIPGSIKTLVAAAFIIALGFGFISPILPQYITSFNVGTAAAGFVISVFAISRLIFAPFAGRLVDALGSRTIYISGLLSVAVTTTLVGVAQEYWHIVALRGLAGFGSTMFTVSAMGLVVKLSPPEIRGRCSGAYASGFLFGSILGPLAGSALSFLGMRWPFVIYGVFLSLASLIVYLRLPKNIGEATPTSESKPAFSPKEAVRLNTYRAALIASFANGWANFGVRIAIVPLFAATVFHQGPAFAGVILAAYAVGNALALQFSGRLADRHGRKPLIIVGLFVSATFTATFGLTEDIYHLIALSVLAGVGSGLYNPPMQASLADLIGNDRAGGKVLASYQMSSDFGAILGPILIGAVVEIYGYEIGFLATSAVLFFAAIRWVFARETLAIKATVENLEPRE